MRKIMMLLLVVCLCIVTTVTSFAFSDVTDTELHSYVQTLQEFNIISGYPDGSFKPNNFISRAEFAKIIATATFLTEYTGECFAFSDVSREHWAAQFIYAAKDLQIISGTSETTFEPDSNITYEQAIKMIVASLGYNEEAQQKGGYPNGYITVANELGILNDVYFESVDYAKRGNIAKIIRKALDMPWYYLNRDGINICQLSELTLFEIHKISTPDTEYTKESFISDEETDKAIEADVG